jgi:hypothetical protein
MVNMSEEESGLDMLKRINKFINYKLIIYYEVDIIVYVISYHI